MAKGYHTHYLQTSKTSKTYLGVTTDPLEGPPLMDPLVPVAVNVLLLPREVVIPSRLLLRKFLVRSRIFVRAPPAISEVTLFTLHNSPIYDEYQNCVSIDFFPFAVKILLQEITKRTAQLETFI